MNITEIRRLIKLVESSGINELEIEEEGSRVKIVKQAAGNTTFSAQIPQTLQNPEQMTQAIQENGPVSASPSAIPETTPPLTENVLKVTSPMVGTFYRAPSPEAPTYVKVGDRVSIGQVLCIVEAMKLMNEIESETTGTIVEICIENAKPVEFGQTMFVIKPE